MRKQDKVGPRMMTALDSARKCVRYNWDGLGVRLFLERSYTLDKSLIHPISFYFIISIIDILDSIILKLMFGHLLVLALLRLYGPYHKQGARQSYNDIHEKESRMRK